MKEKRNIFIAFILNLFFSVFELVGGILTGSIAILSDALHDVGDTAGIGVSYFFEKKSTHPPDNHYTYGYARYSLLGSLFTILILVIGSIIVLYNAIARIISPIPLNYNGIILFAVVGVIVNFIAALFTKRGQSLNQKAVNLHMLEDALGWLVVLIGSIIMRFTNFSLLDPILSIGIALFILLHAVKHLTQTCKLFLDKTPDGISVAEITKSVCAIDGVIDAHHVHVWSIDGQNHCATLHIVTDQNAHEIKYKVRELLQTFAIVHVTIEVETANEHCDEKTCRTPQSIYKHCHHH